MTTLIITRLFDTKGGNETLLIAEDSESVRVLIKSVLEKYGYTVIEALDGLDGINKFKENKDSISLALLDVVMPKKGGKETAQEIKKMCPDVKILFTSGYTAEMLHQRDILAEGGGFISKPVTPAELLLKIRVMLDEDIPGCHNGDSKPAPIHKDA